MQATASVVGTWAMTMGPSRSEPMSGHDWIQVIDQCARRWEIDPLPGAVPAEFGMPVYSYLVPDARPQKSVNKGGLHTLVPALRPFRDMVRLDGIEDVSLFTLPFGEFFRRVDAGLIGGADHLPDTKHFRIEGDFSCANIKGGGRSFGLEPDADKNIGNNGAEPLIVTTIPSTDGRILTEGYMLMPTGGDGFMNGDIANVYGWAGSETSVLFDPEDGLLSAVSVDGVRSYEFDPVLGGSIVVRSTSEPFSTAAGATNKQGHLRSAIGTSGFVSSQSLRIGHWNSSPFAVLGTPGGRVHMLDMNNAVPMEMGDVVGEARSADHGFGGMALCVEPLSGRTDPTIFFATVYSHSTKNGASGSLGAVEPLSSSLHVYEWVSGALVETGSIHFDDSSLSAAQPRRPNLIGVCGLAVGDLITETQANGITEELVVTTLQGDVAIFDLQEVAGDVIVSPVPWFHEIHDGAVGANNSIWIDSSSSPRRLFVAGSMGMRLWEIANP